MLAEGAGAGEAGAELSVLPLDADAIRVCELCGTLGFKRNFYPRNNTYCSLYCYRRKAKNRTYRFILMGSTEHLDGMIPMEPLPQITHPWPAALQDLMRPMPQKIQLVSNSYEWKDELFGCEFLAAPVKLFKHAPLYDMWDNTFEGMKVEVKNLDCEQFSDRLSDYFWVATVIKVKGYMGLLRYEGFGSDDSKDFWVNLCCSEVHPVGWCATRGKPLIPPKSIEDKYSDWKKFLVRQLTGARTLPADFYNKLTESVKSRFNVGTILEVVDKNRISQVKVASVYEIIGKRLHVKYYDSSPEDNGFWCHEDSPLIHPVGWAFTVGHPLDAPPTYCERVAAGRFLIHDATPNMFYCHPCVDPAVPLFREGMKLEAIDPLNLSSVCAATVMKVLHEGYMMIRIDVYPADASGADWFCYHQRSPCIFPVGFSAANNIRLVPPAGYTPEQFTWQEYLSECGAAPAGPELFAARSSVEHGFVAGMRLECADLMDPRLVCVATVARVVGNLLKVHFDGWGEEYDQWLWGHSTDMYPVGWCRAVGHRLEGPLQAAPPPRPARPARRPRAMARKRKMRPAAVASSEVSTRASSQTSQTSITTEDYSQNSNDLADTKSLSPPGFESESNPGVQTSGVPPLRDLGSGVPTPKDDAPGSPTLGELVPEAPDLGEEGPDSPCLGEYAPGVLEPGEQSPESTGSREQSPGVPMSEEQNGKSGEEMEVLGKTDLADLPTDEALEDEMKFAEDPTEKVIPRLVNNSLDPATLNSLDPEKWTNRDVAKFLAVNDCSPYCVNFSHVTGSTMLQLSKDEIIELLEMKVGPSLKIYDLIQQLKCKIKPVQRRSFK